MGLFNSKKKSVDISSDTPKCLDQSIQSSNSKGKNFSRSDSRNSFSSDFPSQSGSGGAGIYYGRNSIKRTNEPGLENQPKFQSQWW